MCRLNEPHRSPQDAWVFISWDWRVVYLWKDSSLLCGKTFIYNSSPSRLSWRGFPLSLSVCEMERWLLETWASWGRLLHRMQWSSASLAGVAAAVLYSLISLWTTPTGCWAGALGSKVVVSRGSYRAPSPLLWAFFFFASLGTFWIKILKKTKKRYSWYVIYSKDNEEMTFLARRLVWPGNWDKRAWAG